MHHASVGNLVTFAGVILLWGVNWPLMKLAIGELGVLNFRAYCVMAGVVWLFGFAWWKRLPLRPPREIWGRLVFLALLNITAWSILSMVGLANLPSGRAALLAYTMPLWVVLLARLFLNERLTPMRLAALVLGMVGVALLLVDELANIQRSPVGAACMLAAGFAWAVVIVATKGLPESFPTTSLIAWQMLIGGVPIVIAAALLTPHQWTLHSTGAWVGLLFNVTLVFGYVFVAWNHLVRQLPAGVSGLASLGVPVVGVLSGIVLLGETPRTFDWLAMALLLGGVALTLKPPRKAQPAA